MNEVKNKILEMTKTILENEKKEISETPIRLIYFSYN